MPSTLSVNGSLVEKECVLTALVTAAANMSGTSVMIYARAVFGDEVADRALARRKDEMKGGMMNGGHGEAYSCRSLMRAYAILKGTLKEGQNAEDLMAVAKGYFPDDVIGTELAVVEMEMDLYGSE